MKVNYIYYVNMRLKLAFFDIDGTLIQRKNKDVITLKSSCFNYALSEVFGLENVNYLTVLGKRIYGLTDKSVLKTTLMELGYSDYLYYEKEADLFRAIDDYFEEQIIKLKEPEYLPNPGAEELLNSLKNMNVKLGLVTGNIKKHSEWKMRGVGFESYFTTGAFGDDGEDRAEILETAVNRNSDIEKSLICHFGDSPLDLESARKLGLKCAVLTIKGGGTHSREELENIGYGLIIDSWTEISKIEQYISGK